MRSMTGYGRGSARAELGGLAIVVELTSVNRKSFDLQLSAPREWTGLEPFCTPLAKEHFERGRIQAQLKIERPEDESSAFAWDESALRAQLARLRAFAEAEDLPFEADSRLLLELAKALRDSSELPAWRELEAAIEAAFKAALDDIDTMRRREGEAIHADLDRRIGGLESITAAIGKEAAGMVPDYRAALSERLRSAGLELELDDERVVREIALFADRCDISEELTRLASHFLHFREIATGDGPCGRKLDFLCQEILRELNTTASKSTRVAITRAVIEAKNELERIREQVQNVE